MNTFAGEDTLDLPPPSQRVVGVFEHIARVAGRPLKAAHTVLDFGAGAGRHVAGFRAAGYEAVGVDQQFVSHERGSVQSQFLHRVSPPDYELSFADNTFDFVYSTSSWSTSSIRAARLVRSPASCAQRACRSIASRAAGGRSSRT